MDHFGGEIDSLCKRVLFRCLASTCVVATLACSRRAADTPPEQCGGSQYALATVVLPDTGINAGREIQVVLNQHDPVRSLELSEIVIQQAWSKPEPDREPSPRVRLFDTSGQVFIDTLGTRFEETTGQESRPTWLVLHWLRDAQIRSALYHAFATQSLWLNVLRADSTGGGTRVRLNTQEFGVIPATLCK